MDLLDNRIAQVHSVRDVDALFNNQENDFNDVEWGYVLYLLAEAGYTYNGSKYVMQDCEKVVAACHVVSTLGKQFSTDLSNVVDSALEQALFIGNWTFVQELVQSRGGYF